MAVESIKRFKDEWLAQSLLTHKVLDHSLYNELAHRFGHEDYIYNILLNNTSVRDEDISLFLETLLEISTFNLDTYVIDSEIIRHIPEEICKKYELIPVFVDQNVLGIVSFNPFNFEAEEELEYLTGKYIKTYFGTRDKILNKIKEIYTPEEIVTNLLETKLDTGQIDITIGKPADSESVVVSLVDQILKEAVDGGVSDIHIEPQEHLVLVRYRIDGILQNKLELPIRIHPALISRIKIISDLDITETRKPQDGKSKIFFDNRNVDLRISLLPTSFGEKVVIRVLDKQKAAVSFKSLGIRGKNEKQLLASFDLKEGMVLVTGPTGSGKSTTLYAALNHLRSTTNNILTIEDPIEYVMEGINQVQVNKKAGITFATALRSFLRQDPDVILVGEIRDRETAEIAVQASLTGHVVLSTLHTNNTLATITRLRDMGIDVYKISESVQAIIAQRLVRKLCNNCKQEITDESVYQTVIKHVHKKREEIKIYEAKGCDQCVYSGYKGRTGIYEILHLNEEIKDVIATGASVQEIREMSSKSEFRDLYEGGMELVAEGITSFVEIRRVAQPSEFSVTDQQDRSKEKSVPIQHAPPEVKMSKQNQKILVVEDTKIIRKSVVKVMSKNTNWEIFEAENGEEAWKFTEKTIPNLIISDINMPQMDGYQLLQALKKSEKTSSIPVLMLTGREKTEDEIKALDLGAEDFITKPFNPEILLARVNRLLTRKSYAKTPDSLLTGYAHDQLEIKQ
jgi:type IV pilus assembly protein PilB